MKKKVKKTLEDNILINKDLMLPLRITYYSTYICEARIKKYLLSTLHVHDIQLFPAETTE